MASRPKNRLTPLYHRRFVTCHARWEFGKWPGTARGPQVGSATMPEISGTVSPGEDQYRQRVQAEIEHYATEYENEESRRTLTQKVPASWHRVEAKNLEVIRRA